MNRTELAKLGANRNSFHLKDVCFGPFKLIARESELFELLLPGPGPLSDSDPNPN